MDFQNIAYVIGGAFLVATLVMLGGRVREIFPAGPARSGKLASGVVGIVLVGLVVQQAAEGRFSRWFGSAPVPSATLAPAGDKKAVPIQPPVHHAGRISAEFVTPDPVVEVKEPMPVPETAAAVSGAGDSNAAPTGSKGKKIVKSVGRFLHIGHKKSAD